MRIWTGDRLDWNLVENSMMKHYSLSDLEVSQ